MTTPTTAPQKKRKKKRYDTADVITSALTAEDATAAMAGLRAMKPSPRVLRQALAYARQHALPGIVEVIQSYAEIHESIHLGVKGRVPVRLGGARLYRIQRKKGKPVVVIPAAVFRGVQKVIVSFDKDDDGEFAMVRPYAPQGDA